ncbi:MUC1-extracellular alpha-1 4-glucan glucosidase [Fusarium pseudocircinatum]|uniref:MUC1-extracellular alpha-1 4-glucan glucosidase n=1 Tax=Fusarium pseudocircinatum TaxID=56676 RepID=A0A8H5L7G3_9HYPO|nr:MUC1-extracellular alpha-1 4-glucan glucosidase [Fusarium pseudocircinatum]
MRLQLGLLALGASSAMAASCQQGTVAGPYTAQGVDFDVICGKGLTGTSYTTQASMMAGIIEECMVACAEDASCVAIVWDNIAICSLYSSFTATTDDYTDIAVRQQQTTSTSMEPSTTSSAASATSSTVPQCQAGTYTSSTNNVQFNTACGRYYVGTEISNTVVADLQGCMDMCASDSSCVAVSLSYSGNVCHLFSHTDYSAPDASWDLAVVSSRPSSTSSADIKSSTDSTSSADSTSEAPSTTSSPPSCQSGTYSGTINQFVITCDASPNAYNTMNPLGSGYTLQTCLQACDTDSQCDAATFYERFTYCTLFNGALSTIYQSVGSVYIYKMTGTSSSSSSSSTSTSSDDAISTSASSTSSTTSSSASSTTSSAPLTCAQLGGTYTGASNTIFEVTCGAILGGSASPPTRVDSFEQCMDLCQADSTCVGVSLFPSMGRCYLVAVYVGSSAAPPYDVAIIPARLPSTSSTSSADSTSTSAAVTTTESSTESSTSIPSTSASSTSTFIHILYILYIYVFVSYVICIYVFHSYTFYSYLTYDYNIHSIFNPIHLYNFTNIIRANLLKIHVTVHDSTLTPATSTSAGSSLLSSLLTTTTTSRTEATTIVTSASTGNPRSQTSTSDTTISSSSTASEISLSSTGQTTTGTESTVMSTQQQTSPITSAPPSGSSTSPSLTASTTSSTPSTSPRNIQVLDGYDFIACMRSDEGFPTFTEVATQADMTTEICVKLAAGSIYVGVYKQTCYKADSLAGSEVVEDARCSLLCPGDPALFCGGTTGGAGRRRAIPSNRLLTIYRQSVSSSSSSSTPSQASQASIPQALPSTSKSNAATTSSPPVSSSSISSRKTTVSPAISDLSSISGTPSPTSPPSPVSPGPIRTIHVTEGVTVTEIVIAETVTTVTYVTLNPSQPGALTTTCITLTLQYTACGCDHQEYPPVDMTTIISPCRACGYLGQDIITMVVPVAACESGNVNYKPSGWFGGEAGNNGYPDRIQGHQIYTGSEGDLNSQPQPTQGQQNGEGLGYENGSSDIEAATQASGGGAQNKQPSNLQPTQGQKSGKGSGHENGPSGSKTPTQRPEDEPQNNETASPVPTQGQHNADRPGDGNGKSAVAAQTSPGRNNNNGPIAPASQSSNPLNPSKPVPLPEGQQVSSDGLKRETSVVPAPQPDTPTSPSQLVSVHGHHPAISTTFATEVEVTKEIEASESTHSLSALEPGEASSVPSEASSSEACRHQIMDCNVLFAVEIFGWELEPADIS